MKIFTRDHNFVTREVAKRFEEVDDLKQADALVTWTDITTTENDQIKLAKELNIPSIVIQHGRRAVVDYLTSYKDVNSGNNGKKIESDYFCCWGKRDYDDLISEGYTDKKIKWTGSPLIPDFSLIQACSIERKPSLITFLSHHDLRTDAEKYNQGIHNLLVKEFGDDYALIYSPGYRYERLEDPMFIDKDGNVYSERDVETIEDKKTELNPLSFAACMIDSKDQNAWKKMAGILKHSKVCVSMMPSSFEGLAAVMDVPIVRVRCDLGVRDKDDNIDYELNEAGEAVFLDEMIQAIKDIEPDKRKEGRREIAMSEMWCEGNAVDNIENVIKEAVNTWKK